MGICASTHGITRRVSRLLPLSHIPAYTYEPRCVCVDAQTLTWNKVQNEIGYSDVIAVAVTVVSQEALAIFSHNSTLVTFTNFFHGTVPWLCWDMLTSASVPDARSRTCDIPSPHFCTSAVRRGRNNWHKEGGAPGRHAQASRQTHRIKDTRC